MNLSRHNASRRRLIKAGVVGATALIFPFAGDATRLLTHDSSRAATRSRSRELYFYNLHTRETLRTVYFENGAYVPKALRQVDYFFRDFRVNEVKAIDPALLDLLYRIYLALDTSEPFNLVSGYRSPATNAWLASHSEGVSHHSLHMSGMASDINVLGRSLALLQTVALAMRGGGVGYYPRSGFVHVDVGRVRHW